MESEIIKLAIQQGVWAILFVFMLLYTLKENKKREEKYQETIKQNQEIILSLSDKFEVVEEIKNDVNEIKSRLDG